MVFSMYQIFGTLGQENLLNIHRFSSIALFIFITLFTLRFINLHPAAEEKK
jgi:hypothetical protein